MSDIGGELMKTKKCTKCGIKKSLNNFSKNKSKKDGLDSWCKDCDKEYRELNKDKSKKYYKQHRNEILEKSKKYRELNKDKLKKQKKEYCKRTKNNKKQFDYG